MRNFLGENVQLPTQSIKGKVHRLASPSTVDWVGTRTTHETPVSTIFFPLIELRGQLNISPEEVAQFADAELRFFPPGKRKTRGRGIITLGDVQADQFLRSS